MSDNSAERIGGWLLGPLAWLIVQLLLLVYQFVNICIPLFQFGHVLFTTRTLQILKEIDTTNILLFALSYLTFFIMCYYTLWLTIAFFKRRKSVPKHYIIWLLVSVLLAVKAFAFSPVSDALAVRQLLFPLLATALLVPYFKRSTRVKKTFVNP